MKKIVKRWGSSLVIVLDEEDKKIYNITEGDVLDLEIKEIKKGSKTKWEKDGK